MDDDHSEVDCDSFRMCGDHFEVDCDSFRMGGVHFKVSGDHFIVEGCHFVVDDNQWSVVTPKPWLFQVSLPLLNLRTRFSIVLEILAHTV